MSPEEIRRHLELWGEAWGTPNLAREVNVRPSKRMFRSLGNYSPVRDEIRIAAHLLATGGRELFLEVLGHEAAHAAVRRLYPGRVRPHGPEWRALMEKVGLPPRATLPVPRAVADVVVERRAKRQAARRQTAQRQTAQRQAAQRQAAQRRAREERSALDRVRRWMEREAREIRRELRARGNRNGD